MSKTIIGKINPNLIKSRDLVHLQEITHPSGSGYHKNKKDRQVRELRRERQQSRWEY